MVFLRLTRKSLPLKQLLGSGTSEDTVKKVEKAIS
jgi:hypothetical protein